MGNKTNQRRGNFWSQRGYRCTVLGDIRDRHCFALKDLVQRKVLKECYDCVTENTGGR